MRGCLLHTPHWGPGPQPRHVPCPGIKPATLFFAGLHSIRWATPARAGQFYYRKILHDFLFTSLFWHASNDTRIAWIDDSQCAHSSVFHTLCPVQYHCSCCDGPRLGQHGTVLCFRSPQGWTVVGQGTSFTLPFLIIFRVSCTPACTSTFHNKWEPRIDRLQRLFCLFCDHHLPAFGVGWPPTKSSCQDGRGTRKGQMGILK